MRTSYYTLARDGKNEITIKGSRFICHLQRVTDEEEAKSFIQQIKKEHWKATHNCAAYLTGDTDEIQRAQDDGEPSGTAGVPMLEVLKKNRLHYVAAVVTRYFGGTKLGAGGLIRAYGKAVTAALNELGIVERSLRQQIDCTVSYSASGKLEHFLKQSAYPILDTVYTDTVTYSCSVLPEKAAAFQEELMELLNGNVSFVMGAQGYVETLLGAVQEDRADPEEDPLL